MNQAQDKLQNLRKELNFKYLDRLTAIDLALVAYLANEHMFMGGPPGTGKTSLMRDVANAMTGTCFYYLADSQTTKDDLLGPIDLNMFKQNKLRKDLTHGIANAEIAILDEGFKADAKVLNSLLGLILDRKIMNGDLEIDVPLKTLTICSNELPESTTDNPFWDRLCLRIWVDNIPVEAKRTLLRRNLNRTSVAISTQLTKDDIKTIQSKISTLSIPDSVLDKLLEITETLLLEHSLVISTRKHTQILNLLKAYAYIQGDKEVTEDAFEVLKHVLWNNLEDIKTVNKTVAKFMNPQKIQIKELETAVKEAFEKIQPYDKSQSRNIWTRDKSNIEVEISEIEAAIKEIGKENPNIVKQPYYNRAIHTVKTIQEKISQMSLAAYQ